MGIVLNGNRNLGVAGPLAGDTTVSTIATSCSSTVHSRGISTSGMASRSASSCVSPPTSKVSSVVIQCELLGYGIDDRIADLDLIEHKAADISGIAGLFPVIADLHSDSSGNPLNGMDQLIIDIHFAVCTTGVIPT